jgi:hypothetical protein
VVINLCDSNVGRHITSCSPFILHHEGSLLIFLHAMLLAFHAIYLELSIYFLILFSRLFNFLSPIKPFSGSHFLFVLLA